MPPAFNLSQDQTLQFNLCGWHFCLTLSSPLTQNTDRAVRCRTVLYFFVSTSMFKVSGQPKPTGAVPSSAHTYRLLIVKELTSLARSDFVFCVTCFAVKSFCLSAAEKRDYAAFLPTRQLLCFLFLQKLFSDACCIPPLHHLYYHQFPGPHIRVSLPVSAPFRDGSRTIASRREPWQPLF